MPARILNGIAIRDQIYARTQAGNCRFERRGNSSRTCGGAGRAKIPLRRFMCAAKSRRASSSGSGAGCTLLRPAVTTEELLALVAELNARDEVDGILVQLPLPPQVDTKRVLEAVDPAKDVDGFHPVNLGRLVSGRPGLVACTPAGCMEILRRSGIAVEGANAVVVGRSDIVGKPMALLLMHANATVTICHSKTRDLPGVVRRADIVVAAIGRAAMVEPDWVRPGRDGDRCGHQSHHRCRRSAAHLCEFPGEARAIPRERLRAGGRRSSGRRGSGRSDDAGAGRRRPAHDRHADEQHGESGAPAPRAGNSGDETFDRRRRGQTLMLRVGLTGGIATGKTTVAAMLRELGCRVLEADKIAHQ